MIKKNITMYSIHVLCVCVWIDVQSPNAMYEYAGDREMIDEEEDIRELKVIENEQARLVFYVVHTFWTRRNLFNKFIVSSIVDLKFV